MAFTETFAAPFFIYFVTTTETYYFLLLAPTDLPFFCFSYSSLCFINSAFVGFLVFDFEATSFAASYFCCRLVFILLN